MENRVYYIDCPEYKFEDLVLEKVGQKIDTALINNFPTGQFVIRAVQSAKHQIPKDELIDKIIESGTDRFDDKNIHQIEASDQQIDFYGKATNLTLPISLSILEGFHRWKPRCLERPQTKADIWLVYDESKLENIEYNHQYYDVKANDAYRFKSQDTNDIKNALLGVLVIN